MKRAEWWLVIPLLLVQAASLRAMAKHVSGPLLAVPAVLAVAGLVALAALGRDRWLALLPPRWVRFALSGRGFALVGLLVVGLVALVYPVADGLKSVGGGSDADDAMIVGAKNLLAHFDPYREPTYFGNLISPGPGWILLVAPLSTTGLYRFFPGLALVALYFLVRRAGASGSQQLAVAIVLLAALGLWENLVVGMDLFPLGVALAASLPLVEQLGAHRARDFGFLLLYALLLTGRVVLPVLVPVAALRLLRTRGTATALGFAGVTLSLIATIHLVFGWRAEVYMPLHVLSKGQRLLAEAGLFGPVGVTLLALAGVVSAWAASRWWRLATHADFVLASALVFSCPLYLAAFADLKAKAFSIVDWEVNYILVTVPLWVYHYAVRAGARAVAREHGA